MRTLLAAVLVAVSVLHGAPAAAGSADLVAHLDGLSAAFPGGTGVYVADPASSAPLYMRNPDEPVITASLYKLGVLIEAERRVDAGDLKYDDTIAIEAEDVTEDGSFEPAGTELTIDRALEAMITVSDNGAALALWRLLGPANIDATLGKLGLGAFHIALDHTEDNTATPRAIGTLFTMLAKRTLVSAAASQRMLARLERQRINDRLPASLPDGVVVAHKTGNLPGLTHDAGIIYTSQGPRVVVAMTWDSYQGDANAFIANVGSLVYAAVLEPPANARFAVPHAALAADTASQVRVLIGVTNAGSNAWAASGPGAVSVIWEMRDDQGAPVTSSRGSIQLPPLAPGKSANVGAQIATPPQPGLYHVTLGLADADGQPLAPRGAATAAFDVRAHLPFLVHAAVQLPKVLHRNEASLLVTRYQALPTAGLDEHDLVLAWRAFDARNGRSVATGSAPVGVLKPASDGTFYSPFVAPNVVGKFRIEYELREGDVAVSDTASTVVAIYRMRTYPDDQGGRALPGAASPAAPPAASPRLRLPFPSPSGSLLPRIDLPSLPVPKGKATPAPASR